MIKDKIKNLIPKPEELTVKENFSNFSLTLKTKNNFIINEIQIEELIKLIDSEDSFSFSLRVDNGDTISHREKGKLKDFIKRIQQELKYYEEGELITVILQIHKSNSHGIITIYSYSDFILFFKDLDLINLLEIFNQLFISNGTVRLNTLEKGVRPFSTANFSLNTKPQIDFAKQDKALLNEHCHFGNSDKYIVNPNYFNPIVNENVDFLDSFNGLCCLLSMIYLFDITSISNKTLYYKINGFKAIQGKIDIEANISKGKDLFYDLFQWCYSSEGNIADKLGLTRNIISIHFVNDLIELDKGVLTSVKSAYKTYLKENVSKYIELRSKIQDELTWIAQKSGEIVDKYISSYQKSIFTFLSFFISVFVLRIISKGGFLNVFNKDVTILSLAFLALSVVFLIFSSWNLRVEKSRLKRKYQNLKERFKDLLVQKDIDNILNEDQEFNYELGYIAKRYRIFLWLWISTILILLIAVIIVSEYI
jgi:hypothetical protein